MPERVIYVVRSWPRLSQTFIVNEVLALERRGLELVVFSLVRSGEVVVQPQVADVRAPVRYVDDLEHGRANVRRQLSSFVDAPMRSARALLDCLLRPGLAAGYGDCSALQCFRHALSVAAVVRDMRAHGDEPVRVHAHFAHDPALVGMLVARLTGLPFSFTAHARDLRLDHDLTGAHEAEHDQLQPPALQRQHLVDDEGLREPGPAPDDVDHPLRHRAPSASARATASSRRPAGTGCWGPVPTAHCLAILSHV